MQLTGYPANPVFASVTVDPGDLLLYAHLLDNNQDPGTAGEALVSLGPGPLGGVAWGAPPGVTFPLTNAADMGFQPNGVANNALDIVNGVGATNGVVITASAAASIDLAAAGTLTIGPTKATAVAITPALTANGGVTTGVGKGLVVPAGQGLDTSGAGALDIGAATATSVVITPATTITGLLTANGGVTVGAGHGLIVPAGRGLDVATAGALDIGAATATSVVITPATSITGGLNGTRITKRVLATAGPGATPTIDTDTYDVVHLTALAAAITSMSTNLTGTPVDGDTLRISFTDNGTARAITWGADFEASTVALPTTTVISTRLDTGFFWNTETSKWRIVASA